jgi:glyoxylase-like metal-dependent hydrolase (beta-lactamase superfamily II)
VDQVAERAVTLGPLAVEVLPAPGHSHDHICLRVRQNSATLLFAGDALFAGGRVVLQDIPDCSVFDTCATIRRLERTAFDALLPGHGVFSLQRGHRHVEAALSRVLRLLAPEAFF